MNDFSLFFLTTLLPIGLATNGFLLIGLLIAKFIWGRYSQRLNNAVEENLNLASQWNALGVSQRDLFKKLRSRWQADRDAWEGRLADVEGQILSKDSRIAKLTAELEGSGKVVPNGPGESDPMLLEVKKLKAEIEAKDAQIEELKAEESRPVPVSPLIPLNATSGDQSDEQRIQELEQDLIDTHDELHRVREDYLKQSELVESLETRLIETEKGQAPNEAVQAQEDVSSAQWRALMVRRSAELLGFRDEIQALRLQNVELKEEVANLDQIAELEKVIEEKEQELKSVIEEKEFEWEKILETKEKERTALEKERKEAIQTREEMLEEARAKESEQNITIESLEQKVEARDAELEELRSKVAELEVLNGRRAGLQVELNDAHHEMYDVRNALNERLDEIEILEARLDELDLAEDEALALANEVKDTRHELSDVRIALNTRTEEYEKLVAQMEELEAIIEDRGAEVNDLSSEVRQQRDEIRSLKNTLAEKEGELEALSEESGTFTVALQAKNTYVDEQSVRIADLEQALADRYSELNEIRRQVGDGDRAAEHHRARADQLEAELERRQSAFEESDHKIAKAEDEIEQANAKIADLTVKLEQSEQSIVDLEEQLSALARDKEETLRDLGLASKRVKELENAASERQEAILRLEDEKREISRDSSSLQRKVDSLNVEIQQANHQREEARISLAELEDALSASDEKTLKLSREIEDKDSLLDELRQEVKDFEEKLAEREEKIAGSRKQIESLEEELLAAKEKAAKDLTILESKRAGIETDSRKGIEKLQEELDKREQELDQYVAQQAQSVKEIESLREKVARRGDAIRDLQAEVSNIMLQRSDRDNEIALLKKKLRATESSVLNEASLATFDEAIQQSLVSAPGEGGTSLDDLDEETESHHTPKSGEGDASESVKRSEPEMDEDAVYFDEGSASLTDRSLSRLDELAGELRRGRSRASVAIVAYSGAEGSAEFNESLSAKRADSVRERLLERGVPRSIISVQSSGQDRRFSDWRARRAELVLVPNAVAETVN